MADWRCERVELALHREKDRSSDGKLGGGNSKYLYSVPALWRRLAVSIDVMVWQGTVVRVIISGSVQ